VEQVAAAARAWIGDGSCVGERRRLESGVKRRRRERRRENRGHDASKNHI
jgi:hypothetical protein